MPVLQGYFACLWPTNADNASISVHHFQTNKDAHIMSAVAYRVVPSVNAALLLMWP